MAATEDKTPKAVRPYQTHGAGLKPASAEGQWYGDCVFCDKDKHFFVNEETGQFDCKVCGQEGNIITFLTHVAERAHEETPMEEWRRLARQRSLPIAALKTSGAGFDGQRWLLPVRSEKGTVRDIRTWLPPRKGKSSLMKSTWGCDVQLYGLHQLKKGAGKTGRIWLCEGEWDAMALRWLLRKSEVKGDVVLAVPGANTFKKLWAKWFAGRHVMLCYDADGPGLKGMRKVAELLRAHGKPSKMEFIHWPEETETGFDVRDFVVHGWSEHREDVESGEALKFLEGLFGLHHPETDVEAGDEETEELGDEDDPAVTDHPPEREVGYVEVEDAFANYYNMTEDMCMALELCLAIVFANRMPNSPMVWLYLISPPGGGKTSILATFRKSSFCVLRSSCTPASLVSGFNMGGRDPSLLPRLNKKCAIFKDGTELLAQHPAAYTEFAGILRGVYDGSVVRTWGNGVERRYEDLHFGMIMGMTPAVHASSTAALGERMLKFQMMRSTHDAEASIWKAIANVGKKEDEQDALCEAVRKFLWRPVEDEPVPKLPKRYAKRLVALAQLIGKMRAQVARDWGGGDVSYRPYAESGTRLAQQLCALAQGLALVRKKRVVGEREWLIAEKVAFHTAIGFHLDIVQAVMMCQEESDQGREDLSWELDANKQVWVRRDKIAELTDMHATTLSSRLEDLSLLGLVRKHKGGAKGARAGQKPYVYGLDEHLVSLWRRARVSGVYASIPSKFLRSGRPHT